MPCVLALIVLSILGIFSASHRKLAKEAFLCVTRRVTLRPCNTGFDVKVKATVLGTVLNRSPKAAKFLNQHFEILAWVLLLASLASFGWTARGIYNYWAWGNCNGANTGGFCAFDPTGQNNKTSTVDEGQCVDSTLAARALNMKSLTLANYPTKGAGDKQIVFIGCYNCDYTRKAWPMIKDLLSKVPATLTFMHFPVKPETKYLMAYDVCVYNQSQEKYWQWVDQLFAEDKTQNADENHVKDLIKNLGLNMTKLNACLASPETIALTDKRYKEIQKTGIYGTPTVFVNGTPVVGPKPERVYRRLLNGTWF